MDVDAIRAQFPILERDVHGKPLIYLDSAASAQKPDAVLDAMMGLARTSYANVHRGLHTLANETTEAYEKARETVARFINADRDEVVWTKSATEAVNLVASSFGLSLNAGDEIVLSEMEHHANIVPWHFLRERKGVVLKFIPVLDDGRLDMEAYLSFQYPLEIPGVPALTFIRTALNAQRRARGEDEIAAPAFLKLAKEKAAALKIDFEMLKRGLNVGFSGGEKKRMEIFQMSMLSPRFLILDETDSGLDIDALKIVSEGVNALRSPERGMLVITHYQRLLDHIKPDKVHVLAAGRIVASGGPELALQLEAEGYDRIVGAAA